MKVLHIAPSAARREGGPSEVLRGLLPALRDLGVSTRLITTDKGMDETDNDLRDDKSVLVFPARHLPSWSFAPSTIGPIRREIAEADVVHIHSIHTFTTSVALRAARKASAPSVLQPHGALDSYHWNQGRLKKVLYSKLLDARGMGGLSGGIYSSRREEAEALITLPKLDPYLVPLGVDENIFSIQRTPSSEIPSILFMGRVTEKKRLDLLLKAFAILLDSHPSCRLLVAGPVDPRLPYSPHAIASELGVLSSVSFLGQVDSVRRKRLLSESSVFCLPSEDESFGMAVAEALAAGCPVVASRQVGIAEEVAQAGGLILSDLNATDIASGLRRALGDDGESQKLVQTGRRYALEHFTWRHSALAAKAAYDLVAVSPSGRDHS